MDDKPSDSLVQAYVGDILERAHSLEELALELSSLEYVSVEAPELTRAVARLAVNFREAIYRQWQRYLSHRRHSDLTLLRGIDRALRELVGELRLPTRATSDRVPGVLTRLVAMKAGELEPNAGVILRPQWNYGYKIHSQDVHARYRELLGEAFEQESIVTAALEGLKAPLYIISFPVVERRSIHLHAVIGHELGHLMASKYSPSAASDAAFAERMFKVATEEDEKRSKRRTPRVNQSLLFTDREEIIRATEARRCAVREFAADAAGVLLFGMAAVFSAAQVAVSRNLDGRGEPSNRYYPSWGLRLYYMMQLAEKSGWLALDWVGDKSETLRKAAQNVQARWKEMQQWIGDDPTQWRARDVWVSHGHESAIELLPSIHEFLRTQFYRSFCEPRETYSRIPALFERLCAGIPPDSVSDDEAENSPANLQDIFTVSWWYRLSEVQIGFADNDLNDESREQAECLRRLTIKAIENIDFVHRFRQNVRTLNAS